MGTSDEGQTPFIMLYEEHKNALFNYLMYRVNFNRSLADDLFMDVMLKAYEHFPSFDVKKGSFKTWLFGIAHNHLANYWRDRKEAVSLDGLEEQGVTLAVSPPTHGASAMSEHRQIQKVLSLLNEDERVVISLRFIDQLEFCEIAEVLRKKEGAVRTQLSRAMSHFKQLYDKVYPNA